jgi:hypothetical protein
VCWLIFVASARCNLDIGLRRKMDNRSWKASFQMRCIRTIFISNAHLVLACSRLTHIQIHTTTLFPRFGLRFGLRFGGGFGGGFGVGLGGYTGWGCWCSVSFLIPLFVLQELLPVEVSLEGEPNRVSSTAFHLLQEVECERERYCPLPRQFAGGAHPGEPFWG